MISGGRGAYWFGLSEIREYKIAVHRGTGDDAPLENWDQVRIMLWIIQEPPT